MTKKHDALPPAASIRKAVLKDESDCLKKKSEATPHQEFENLSIRN